MSREEYRIGLSHAVFDMKKKLVVYRDNMSDVK